MFFMRKTFLQFKVSKALKILVNSFFKLCRKRLLFKKQVFINSLMQYL